MTKRSLISASLLIISLLTSPLVGAASIPILNNNTPDSYIVKKGDTLWDISAIFLEDPWLWPDIWRTNPAIDNPHLIYPGDEIRLLIDQGQPYLTLYPSSTGGHAEHINADQSLIPMAAIREFLTKPLLAASDQFQHAATIIGSADNRLMYAHGDSVYVTNNTVMVLNQTYSIYRAGAMLRDPDNGQVLGQQAIHIGQAVVTHSAVPARVTLINTKREVRPGDRLLASPTHSAPDLTIQHADIDLSAQVIALFEALSQVGNYQVVVSNAGRAQGLRAGHIVALQKRGVLKNEQQLPDQSIGSAMIFKAFDELSYLLILDTNRPISVGDLISAG